MATVGAEEITNSEEQQRFLDWMDSEDFELTMAVKREEGNWFALLLQFDITGMGATRQEAITEAFAMMVSYLHAYYEDGQSIADAIRPVPLGLRVRIEAESVVARALRKIPLQHLELADESRYDLPPGQLSKLALC